MHCQLFWLPRPVCLVSTHLVFFFFPTTLFIQALDLVYTCFCESMEQLNTSVWRISISRSIIAEARVFKLDMASRISIGWTKGRQASGILYDCGLPIQFKGHFCKMTIRLILLYGAECRAATRKPEVKVHTVEMHLQRETYEVTKLKKIHKRKYKGSCYRKTKSRNIIWDVFDTCIEGQENLCDKLKNIQCSIKHSSLIYF